MSQDRCLCHKNITREFALENQNLCFQCGKILIVTNNLNQNLYGNENIDSNYPENSIENLVYCNCENYSINTEENSCNTCRRLIQNLQISEFNTGIYQNERNYSDYFIRNKNELPFSGE